MYACSLGVSVYIVYNIFYVLLGQSVSLRQVRGGVELPPIDQNLFYDFDYQLTNHITPRVVLPVSVWWL